MWNIYSLFEKLFNILFPIHCYICKKENENICKNCIKKFSRSIDSPALYINSTFSFKDKNIKNIIHSVKYYHRKDLIKPLVLEVGENLKKFNNFKKINNWTLIPIPISRLRKITRGYNQSLIIAKELSKIINQPINETLLIRCKDTKHQAKSQSRSERLLNQKNSFKINGNIKNMNIILIDDVTTTGATLEEARKTLIKNNAGQIIAVTIAH